MDLIERYLAAIRSQLPDEQKTDVTAELRDLIMSQVEDRESALGRPLTRAETEALLKDFGHPLVVAGRYRKFNQLIGPEVFPFYWFSLKTILTIVLVVNVVITAVTVAASGNPGDAIGDGLGRMITGAVATLGWVTVAFVAIEYAGAVDRLQQWSLRHLPTGISKPRKSRFDAALELAFTIVFIAWWTGWAPWSHYVFTGGSDLTFTGGPMREALHWPILWLAGAGVLVSAMELIRPSWNRVTVAASFLWHLAAVALLLAYLRGGQLVEVSGDTAWQAAQVERGLNLGLTIGLSFGAAGMAFAGLRDLWWLLRRGRANGGPALGAAA